MLKYFIAPLTLVATIMSAQVASAVPVLFQSNFRAGDIVGDFYIDFISQTPSIDRATAATRAAAQTFTVGGSTVNGSLLAIRSVAMMNFAAGTLSGTDYGWVDGDRGSDPSQNFYSFSASSGGGGFDYNAAGITLGNPNTSNASGNVLARVGGNPLVSRNDPSQNINGYWVQFIVNPVAVPVPASMPLMAAGLGALVLVARRKKKAKEAAAKIA